VTDLYSANPLLIAIAVAVVPLFVLTRAGAAWNRRTHAQARLTGITAAWRLLQPQRRDGFYRSAVVNDRDNLTYGLALGLRARFPRTSGGSAAGAAADARIVAGESDINLQLARLAAQESKPAEAVRYYHIALDQLWMEDQRTAEPAHRDAGSRSLSFCSATICAIRLSRNCWRSPPSAEGAPSFDRADNFSSRPAIRAARRKLQRALAIDRHDEKARGGRGTKPSTTGGRITAPKPAAGAAATGATPIVKRLSHRQIFLLLTISSACSRRSQR